MKQLIKECGFFNDDEEEDIDFDDEDYSNLNISPSHEIHVLIINDMIDLNNHVFTGEVEAEHNNIASDEEDSETLDEKLDFTLIEKISALSNM